MDHWIDRVCRTSFIWGLWDFILWIVMEDFILPYLGEKWSIKKWMAANIIAELVFYLFEIKKNEKLWIATERNYFQTQVCKLTHLKLILIHPLKLLWVLFRLFTTCVLVPAARLSSSFKPHSTTSHLFMACYTILY